MRTEIEWTDAAWERWQEAIDHCHNLGAHFGNTIEHEHMANLLLTFQRATFAAGPVNVQVDGDGFLITSIHITIGLVWTADQPAVMAGRIDPVGRIPIDHIPNAWPRTGTWSAHS